jgi:hypothetical protein
MCELKPVCAQAALAEEVGVSHDTVPQEGQWGDQKELERNQEKTRQEELSELEREEAILAAAREDLAMLVNMSGSDDEDELVRT